MTLFREAAEYISILV